MSAMTIWILAIFVLAVAAMAGWRQGAIRAGFSFFGILLGALLAVPVGKLVHPLLLHMGVHNPLTAWALAPVIAFIIINTALALAGQPLHKKVEHFYRYNAGDLRQALWERMNSRVGICIGLLNGGIYFILIIFLVYNFAYLTTQAANTPNQPALIRGVNRLGEDLQSSGLSRTACAVGSLAPMYYQCADLAGFLMQNPKAGQRFADYPGLTSLWEREELQPLVQDPMLTNAPAAGASLGEILDDVNVKTFLGNKDQTKLVLDALATNMDDLTTYLETGKSAKYDGQKIIGRWDFNPAVSLAWMRQANPKMPASEMRNLRAWFIQAFAQTHVLATGDNQLFVKGMPRVKVEANQGPNIEHNDWKGDWAANGTNYDLHLVFGSDEKFMTASAEQLRLTIKDGKSIMIFDRAY